jgi:hypothetical protein
VVFSPKAEPEKDKIPIMNAADNNVNLFILFPPGALMR